MAQQVLLVVDMLNDFLQEEGSLYIGSSAAEVIENVEQEIKAAQKKDLPIIYICDNHEHNDDEFNMFPSHCVAGTKGAEVISRLTPQPEDYIVYKRRYSAFCGTDLDIILRELGVEELILTGVCTNICILYTAADARSLVYQVQVIEKAVSSFDDQAHNWALQELESNLGAKLK
ncbi:MAG: cysteine hydrolase family protein [Bacillota bacterium]